jgi:archaellin
VLTYQEGDTYVSGIAYNSTISLSSSLYSKSGDLVSGIENLNTTSGTDYDKAQFYIRRLKDRDSSGNENEVLEPGEIIEILYWIEKNDGTDIPLDPDDQFIITVQPKAGQTTTVKKTAPSVISQKYTTEWG